MKRILLSLLFAATACTSAQFSVTELKCEGLTNPLGIDNTNPHLSWKIESKFPMKQAAYEIEMSASMKGLEQGRSEIWKSGKVNSNESVMVPYCGKQLDEKTVYYWRTRVYDEEGTPSDWSEPQGFSTGILDGKMAGEFITFGGENKAPLFRKSFEFKKSGHALLYVSSLGYHYVIVNGFLVSKAVLNPAVSQLDKRALINTYDINPYLKDGHNELLIWAGQGWYKKASFDAERDAAVIKAELDVDGTTVLATDASWVASESGYTDLGTCLPHEFTGEKIDARITPKNFGAKDLKKKQWSPVDIIKKDSLILSQQMCQSNSVKEKLHPVSIEPLDDSLYIADFGKVINGLFGMKISGLEEGHRICVRYCDFMGFDGKPDMTQREYDIYITSGRKTGDLFVNRFASHPYRYVIISGLEEKPDIKNIFGEMISTGFEQISSFFCSDDDINKIHDMIQHTIECLSFNGYMVDCPHIERGGYGGDGNSSTNSFQTMFDADATYYNWMQAWRDCQHDDGGLPHTAPMPYKAGGGPYWCSFIVAAPYRTFLHYGDPRLIENCWEAMNKWFSYVEKYSVDGLLYRWPDTEYRNWYLGDWLAPKGVDFTNQESVDLVSNCAISRSLDLMAKIAAATGRTELTTDFLQRKEAINTLIHKTFYKGNGIYASGSQIDLAYPLICGLVPQELQEEVHQRLLERINGQDKGHIGVGLTGIPLLTECLTKSGDVETMYTMLKQKDYPGYLYMIEKGATTTWESWDAERSRVHNCYNGIGTWFYEAIGGITCETPGYRNVRIRPQIPAGIDWAKVSQTTPYGTIKSEWKKDTGNKVRVHVEIPVGCSAAIWTGTEYTIKGNGIHEATYAL